MKKWLTNLQRTAQTAAPSTTIQPTNPTASKLVPRPFASTPTSPSIQHVYVLPTINNKLVFHPRLPVPANALERSLAVSGYVVRKWRFAVWDEVASNWHHYLGPSVNINHSKQTSISSVKQWLYEKGNSWGTRKADAEYFFKGIPLRTDHIEFIYPSCVSLRQVKAQLNEYLLTREKSKRAMFLWSVVVFPPALFLSKFVLPIMNVAFCYLAFRVVSAWRAVTVGARVQNIVDLGRVSFTESQQFQKRIKEVVASVENDLANNSLVEGGGVGGAPLVWKWDGKGDLHDLVLERLEKEYGMYEWVRTYRRTRMVHFIHDRKIE